MQTQEYLAMIDSITNLVGVAQAIQQNKMSHEHEISAAKLSSDLMQKEGQVDVDLVNAVEPVSEIPEEGQTINVRV